MERDIYLRISLLACVAGLLGSCIGEDTERDTLPAGERTQVTFSIKIPGAAPATRALQPAHEDAVSDIDVYVFDNTGALVDIGHGRNMADATVGNTVMTNFNVTLSTGLDRDIMVLANARDIVSSIYTGGVPLGETKADFTRTLTTTLPATGWNADPADPAYRAIPMWGVAENIDIDASTNLTGAANSIKISRMVARVNVDLAAAVTNFKLTSVRVYNYSTAGRLIPDAGAGNWTDPAPYATKPSLPANPGTVQKPPLEYLTMTTPDEALKGEIYLFEALKGVSSQSTQPGDDWMENPCLVIGGEYGGSGVETFYRIDFASSTGGTTTYLDILRNHSYNVTIQKVSGPGKADEDEAYNSLPVNIESEVLAWNDNDMNDIESDGQYQLTVDKNTLRFYDEGRSQTMKIYTDYPYGWKVEQATLPVWLAGNITPSTDNSGTSVEVEVEPGNIAIAASALGKTITPGDTLRYSFFITAGSIRKEIFVEQVNKPELTISVTPTTLTFYRSAPSPKSVTVSVYPADSRVYFTESPGAKPITSWFSFPSSGVQYVTQFDFQPDLNNTNDLLSSFVTVYTQDASGMIVSQSVTILQYATDLVLAPSNTGPYNYTAGNYSFTATSSGDWQVTGATPVGVASNFDTATVFKDTDSPVTYPFTLMANNSWAQRTITFQTDSPDPDFAPQDVAVTQDFRVPEISINTTSLDLGSTDAGTSGSVTVTSNAKWRYTTAGDWSTVVGSATVNPGTDGGAHSYSVTGNNTVTFTPVPGGAASGTPAAGAYIGTAVFTTTDHAPATAASSGTLTVTRTVPAYFEFTGVSPTTLTKDAQKVRVSVNTNAAWSISSNVNTSASKTTAQPWSPDYLDIDIPANDSWRARTVIITYSGTNNDAAVNGTALSVVQPCYSIGNPTFSHTRISSVGDNVTVTLPGDYPVGYIEIQAVSGSWESVPETTNINNQATFTIPLNDTGKQRSVFFQYRRFINGEWETKWTVAKSVTQVEVLRLSTGAVAAYNDMSETLYWAEAMGIATNYNTQRFNGVGVDGKYIQTQNTGCAVYEEGLVGRGHWRLPTRTELLEMQPYTSWNFTTGAYYWSSTESSETVAYTVIVRNATSQGFLKTLARRPVRCVHDTN